MRATLAALALLAAATPSRAQTAPAAGDSPWLGRFAVGVDVQDPWAYSTRAVALGGTVGYRLGERLALRVDVWHARFGARIDHPCDIFSGGLCGATARASDREDQWAASAALEWQLEQRGVYLVGGIAALHRSGAALGSPGVSAGPMLGLGLRLGSVIALEARAVRLIGTSPGREAWSLPVVLSLGP